jgi:hypothetical protein
VGLKLEVMQYKIARLVIGCQTEVFIDKAQFEQIREARDALFLLLAVEMNCDILIGNWLQLEKAVMSLSLEWFAHRRSSRTDMDRDHAEINRNVANLLSSARGFIDQTKHHLASLPGSTKADQDKVDGLFRAQYDSKLGYRASEALRNYAQHCGLPSPSFQYPMQWTEEAVKRLAVGFCPYLSTEELRSDPKFKTTLIEELESAMGKTVPVIPLLREYVEGLSTIMSQVRDLSQTKKDAWFKILDDWESRYRDAEPDEPSIAGLAALQIDDKGYITEEIHLAIDFKERIATFQEFNRVLVNLAKLQVRI